MPYSGKTRDKFCIRLGNDWRRLANYFDIPTQARASFEKGSEADAIWEWLENREILEKSLPDALTFIDRDDLVKLLEPESITVTVPQTQWQGSPYPGLLSFNADQASIFFGREKESDELVNRLRKPDSRFLAIIGASGSGKSSLVAAGLHPRIAPWPWITFKPGEAYKDPFFAFATGLKPHLQTQGYDTQQIHDELRNIGNIGHWVEQILSKQEDNTNLIIFIDQFEELFTVVAEEHRKPFAILLNKMTETERLRTIITLRADFYHHCIFSPLDALLNAGQYSLKAPDLHAVMQMITGPATIAGLAFECDLANRILRDTGTDPGALALMAFALSELYNACQPNKMLTHAAYDNLKGVVGAIAKRAETAYNKLDINAQNTFGDVFKELVEVDTERGIPTRKRAKKDIFSQSPAASTLIESFSSARLLVCDESEENDVIVEVAHEALLTNWPLLKNWIEERKDDFRLRRQLQHAALEWEQRGEAYRWTDERILDAREMIKRLDYLPSDLERRFLIPIELGRMLEEIKDPTTKYNLRLMSVNKTTNLVNNGYNLVIVALVSAELHIRVFDISGKRVVDKSENKLVVGDVLTALKAKLNSVLSEGSLLKEDKEKIIKQAVLIASYTPVNTHEHRAFIGVRMDSIGDLRFGVGLWVNGLPDINWCHVPCGEIKLADHLVTFSVKPFYISKYLITWAQYSTFLEADDGFFNSRWWQGLWFQVNTPSQQFWKFDNHPANNICWLEAVAFCRWLSYRLGYEVRLPTEWEWQQAATGGDSERDYPWGSLWNTSFANTYESDLSRPTAVGLYPEASSPCGALDMCGNFWEWCLNEYDHPERTDLGGEVTRVLRGGSWCHVHNDARTTYRFSVHPDFHEIYVGFRVVCTRPPSILESQFPVGRRGTFS